jgi:hypothetical protein
MKFSVADSEKQSAALRSVEKHFQEGSAEQQIRSATLGGCDLLISLIVFVAGKL